MTPLKWLASFLGLLLLIAGGAIFYSRPGAAPVENSSQEPAAVSSTAVSTSVATAFQAAPPMKRVMDLYEAESKRIGQVDPDPKLTETRLTAAAKALSSDEIRWLGDQALDPKGDMDARFFATYLVGLNGTDASVEVLGHIGLAKIPKSKQEMRVAEARALSMQGVEGLAHTCTEAAKDKLLEIISVQLDEAVRDRAHRALYACQTGKKIEDGDQQALDKLLGGKKK